MHQKGDMKYVSYWEPTYMRCHHKQLAAWSTWRPDLCTPDIFHVTISGVLDGKPNMSASGCTHSSWKQDSGITLSLWPLSVPKQYRGTFTGDIHYVSFPCNLAKLAKATLLTASQNITSHLYLPVTKWHSTISWPFKPHHTHLLYNGHTHYTTLPLSLACYPSDPYQQNVLTFPVQLHFLDYIHTEDGGSKFLQHTGNYAAQPQSISKVFLKLMQQQSKMCNSTVLLLFNTLIPTMNKRLYKRFFPFLYLLLRCQLCTHWFLHFTANGKFVAS